MRRERAELASRAVGAGCGATKVVCGLLFLTALFVGSATPADEVISNARARQLLSKYSCQSCHSVDASQLPGPSFRDIAKKYASDPQAIDDLEESVQIGSSGSWGDSAMPSNDVPDKDLKAIIVWILQLM
jgi:cytochrome c551/c552